MERSLDRTRNGNKTEVVLDQAGRDAVRLVGNPLRDFLRGISAHGEVDVGIALLFIPSSLPCDTPLLLDAWPYSPLSLAPSVLTILQCRSISDLEVWWLLPIDGRRAAGLAALEQLIKFDLIRFLIIAGFASIWLMGGIAIYHEESLFIIVGRCAQTTVLLGTTAVLLRNSFYASLVLGGLSSSNANLRYLATTRGQGIRTKVQGFDPGFFSMGFRDLSAFLIPVYLIFMILYTVLPWQLYGTAFGAWTGGIGMSLLLWALTGQERFASEIKSRYLVGHSEFVLLWNVVWHRLQAQ